MRRSSDISGELGRPSPLDSLGLVRPTLTPPSPTLRRSALPKTVAEASLWKPARRTQHPGNLPRTAPTCAPALPRRRISKDQSRPHFTKGVKELEQLLEEFRDKPELLRELADELEYRTRQRAVKLARAVEEARNALRKDVGSTQGVEENRPRKEIPAATSQTTRAIEPAPARSHPAGSNRASPPSVAASRAELPPTLQDAELALPATTPDPVDPEGSLPPLDRAEDIMRCWVAIEALSPAAYRNRKDLVIGDGGARELGSTVPWQENRKAKPRTQLYYVAFIGSVRLDYAVPELLRRFSDPRPDRNPSSGRAALAAVIVDRHGVPLERDPIAVSSFGWACGQVLRGNLNSLGRWPTAERLLTERLSQILIRTDDEGSRLPLDRAQIDSAYNWLVSSFALSEELVAAPDVVTWMYHRFGKGDPTPPLLNSFFLKDLLETQKEIEQHKAPPPILSFLSSAIGEDRVDLLNTRSVLGERLRATSFPSGRWPAPGRHPLVMLQQYGVNEAVRCNEARPVHPINGPPGTGKTTLLRDIVACQVTERARALLALKNAEDAFTHTAQAKIGGGFVHLYRIDDRLRGFELLVASSNNKAVENISRELPRRSELDEGFAAPEYFRATARHLYDDDDSWGTIAAVLGNAANRAAYADRLWWDEDHGLRKYLGWVLGERKKIPIPGEGDNAGEYRLPRSVQSSPPPDLQAAAAAFERAKREFRTALTRVESILAKVEDARIAADLLQTARREQEHSAGMVDSSRGRLSRIDERLDRAKSACSGAEAEAVAAREAVKIHRTQRPGLLARVFRTSRATDWGAKRDELVGGSQSCERDVEKRRKDAERQESLLRSATAEFATAQAEFARQIELIEELSARVGDAEPYTQGRSITASTLALDHEAFHVQAPTLSDAAHLQRDEVFRLALNLQKAFILAAARPIRQNLSAFVALLQGKLHKPEHLDLAPDLWTTAFTVTPVISTTFASVGRLMAPLSTGSLGWLLIDEAGQAKPQAAIGAMRRCKRAVIVGDPLQLEPIESMPLSLLEGIAASHRVDPERWLSPMASAQSVADQSSRFGAAIQTDLGETWIGSPLVVHRRCIDPMFTMSNQIAYGGSMIRRTVAKESPVTSAIGSSAWFDVPATGTGKWSVAEGHVATELVVRAFTAQPRDPSVFVITPFRDTASSMRAQLEQSCAQLGLTREEVREWAANNVGTIHTFQGKEAHAVILLLGASGNGEAGARRWATSQVNLLNVAVSRAKLAIYVVGSHSSWAQEGNMRYVSALLERKGVGA